MILRIVIAFIVAPFVPALMVFAIAHLPFVSSLETPAFRSAAGLAFFSPLVSVPAMVVLGVPMFFWFCAKGWVGLRHAIPGGGAVGIATVAIYFAYLALTAPASVMDASNPSSPFQWGKAASMLAAFATFGMIMGASFWYLAFWKPGRRRVRASSAPPGGGDP